MLNRRHIRIKVMQTIYAMQQNQSDLMDSSEKFLTYSLDSIRDLYLLMLSSLIEVQKVENEFLELSSQKHLATQEEKNPNTKFINNKLLLVLVNSESLNNNINESGIKDFKVNDQYIKILLSEIKDSDLYKDYMKKSDSTFVEDRDFVISIFTDIIAPNEKIYEYLEDNKLTWVDDIPLVNTAIVKQLGTIKTELDYFKVPRIYKDEDDKEYAKLLFRKTILNTRELADEFKDKTPNWDVDRIADLDIIILKMAICELQKFASIPVKVTINEYLEIAKEYSTSKSSIFINGILDALVKEYQKEGKFTKVGRGLM